MIYYLKLSVKTLKVDINSKIDAIFTKNEDISLKMTVKTIIFMKNNDFYRR